MKIFTRNIIVIFLMGMLPACGDVPTAVRHITQPITEDHSNITDPLTRWKAYNLKNYVIEQRNSCFCPYGGEICKLYVRNNNLIDVIKKSDGKSIFNQFPQRYKTVDDLFALVSSINPDSVASIFVQYDQRFGFPQLISVDVSSQITDEGFAYTSGSIKRLLN